MIPEAVEVPEANPKPPLARDVVLVVKTNPLDPPDPPDPPDDPDTVPWNNPEPDAPD